MEIFRSIVVYFLFEDDFQSLLITNSINCGSRTTQIICFIFADFWWFVVVEELPTSSKLLNS